MSFARGGRLLGRALQAAGAGSAAAQQQWRSAAGPGAAAGSLLRAQLGAQARSMGGAAGAGPRVGGKGHAGCPPTRPFREGRSPLLCQALPCAPPHHARPP